MNKTIQVLILLVLGSLSSMGCSSGGDDKSGDSFGSALVGTWRLVDAPAAVDPTIMHLFEDGTYVTTWPSICSPQTGSWAVDDKEITTSNPVSGDPNPDCFIPAQDPVECDYILEGNDLYFTNCGPDHISSHFRKE